MAETGSPETQGLLADPNSTVPDIEYEGRTVAVYDVVWRSGIGDGNGIVRGYAFKSLVINRIEVEDELYIYRTYKAYFVYTISNGIDTLTNEYNCNASADELTFSDFTFVRGGLHSEMEKPRFFFPEPPVLDDDEFPLMGLAMVIRKSLWQQVIVGAWAKIRESMNGQPATLSDDEHARLSNMNGVARGVLQQEIFNRWFG